MWIKTGLFKTITNTLLSEIFAGRKFRGLAIFLEIAKFNSREYQDFLPTAKFISAKY